MVNDGKYTSPMDPMGMGYIDYRIHAKKCVHGLRKNNSTI